MSGVCARSRCARRPPEVRPRGGRILAGITHDAAAHPTFHRDQLHRPRPGGDARVAAAGPQRPEAVRFRDRDRSIPRSAKWPASMTSDCRRRCVAYDCRNNRLAQLGLEQDGFAGAVRASAARWGSDRVGVFIGTSTPASCETEIAFRQRDAVTGELPPGFDYRHRQNSFSVSDYVRRALGLEGPAASLCTACSSSAKAFATAQRMIAAGLIDAAVVGGVDSLCLTTLYGFHSLQLTAPGACRPFDLHRDGLSIGEAAAFALLERAPPRHPRADAFCCSATANRATPITCPSPHPEGAGARARHAARRSTPPRCRQPRWTTSICMAPVRRATTRRESIAVNDLFGDRPPAARPRRPPATRSAPPARSRPSSARWRCSHGLMPAASTVREPDPKLQRQLPDRPAARSAAHACSAIRLASAAPTARCCSACGARMTAADGRASKGSAYWVPGCPTGPAAARCCREPRPIARRARCCRRRRCCRRPNGAAQAASSSWRWPSAPRPCVTRGRRCAHARRACSAPRAAMATTATRSARRWRRRSG